MGMGPVPATRKAAGARRHRARATRRRSSSTRRSRRRPSRCCAQLGCPTTTRTSTPTAARSRSATRSALGRAARVTARARAGRPRRPLRAWPRCASASGRASRCCWRRRSDARPGRPRAGTAALRPPAAGVHPPLDFPQYRSTQLRAPLQAPVDLPQRLTEITGPLLGEGRVTAADADLTRQHDGEPPGPADHRPRAGARQRRPAGAAHAGRGVAGQRRRPLPPRRRQLARRRSTPTSPALGRSLTDGQGRYEFTTIKPGAYPWGNHHNAWRPAHIHFSLFGRAFTQRLVTQMYFPDDPLFSQDPIFNADPRRARGPPAISRFDLDAHRAGVGAGLPSGTSCCAAATRRRSRPRTTETVTAASEPSPSQTVGPYLSIGLAWHDGPFVVPEGTPGAIWLARTRPATATASRSPTRWSRPGRPTPTAASTTPTTRVARSRAATASAASGAAAPTPAGVCAVARSSPARCRPPTARPQAPHVDVSVFARGLLDRVVTRIYFADEAGGQRRRSGAVCPSGTTPRDPGRPTRPRRLPARRPPAAATARPSSSCSDEPPTKRPPVVADVLRGEHHPATGRSSG